MKRLLVVLLLAIAALSFGQAQAGTYSSKVLAIRPSDLRGYWPLNETSGTQANDLSGNGGHGTYYGVALNSFISPDTRSAGYWDGINDSLVIPHSTTLSPAEELTMALWLRLGAASPSFSFVAQKSDGGWTSGGYGIYVNSSDVLGAWVDNYANNLIIYPFSLRDIWIHLVLVYDGETLSLYQNGVLGQQIIRPGLIIREIAEPLGINAEGSFAHLAVWGAALTEIEIAELALPSGTPDTTPTPALPAFAEMIELASGRTAGVIYSISAGDILIVSFLFLMVGLATLSLILQLRRK